MTIRQKIRHGERPGEPVQRVETALRADAFKFEIENAMRCILAGVAESPAIPHADTLATLRPIDEMRARLGVRYPFERHRLQAGAHSRDMVQR